MADSFRFPLGTKWTVAQGFADKFVQDWCGFHLAEDAVGNPGDPVFSAANGIVRFSENVEGIGHGLNIEHTLADGSRVTTVYYHMRRLGKGGIALTRGDLVHKGQLIGFITERKGDYGTGPHLHFGIRAGAYQSGVDPRTGKWFYPGYTGIYRNRVKQCNGLDPIHREIVSEWRSPSQFVSAHMAAPDFWIATNGPDPSNAVFTAGLVAASPGELFASTNKGCFDNNALGVLRSFDKGASWTQINFGFFSTNVRTLLLTPAGDLFAGTHAGVFRFDRTLSAWSPSGLDGVDVNVLRATSNGLWAADSCFCSGLRQSNDNGQTWHRFDSGLPTCVNAVVQHPSGDLYAGTGTSGVFRLAVGSLSWGSVNEGLGVFDLHTLAVNASGDLFAGTIGGLFRRRNGTAQWMALTQGLPSDGIQSIAIGAGGKIVVGTFSHGVYTSADNGDTWTEMNSGITDVSRTVGAIAFDSQGFAYVSVGSIVYRSAVPLQ